MNMPISLEDYRFQYPNSTSIPTLSQSGLIGGLLARRERRLARRAQRRAIWNFVVGLPFRGLAWIVDLFRPHAPAPTRAPHIRRGGIYVAG
ncbi:hypothetical protein EV701_11457 [Chthoniobacter flavus]|uniref:hypothetical protein n=1 Tax=Chthoniobacter flavus TaxID=191863 RepID=UPI001050AC0F|nr:hypothetical protein [Chthoniobacter flavus]TCO89323.1 hypothetical protein EV701_11457 [Chthoniobacter flavus]